MALIRCSTSAGGGGTTIELSGVCSSEGGIVIDTQTVSSVKYKFSNRNSVSDSLRINVSNSARTASQNVYYYGTNVKVVSSIMSNFEDLLSISGVSGYRYIVFASDRTASLSQVDLQIS